MVDKRVIVHMLLSILNGATIHIAFSTLTREYEVGAITRHTIMQCDDIMIHTGVCLLMDIHIAHAYILIMSLLKASHIEVSTIAYHYFHYLSGEEIAVVSGVVAEEYSCFSTVFEVNKHAASERRIFIT